LEISLNKNPSVVHDAASLAATYGTVRIGREMTDAVTLFVTPPLSDPLKLLDELKKVPGVISAGQA